MLVYKEIRVPFSIISYTMQVKTFHKKMILKYNQTSGYFVINRGSWTIKKISKNKTLLIYYSELKTKNYIPPFLQEIAFRKSIPDFYKAIEKKSTSINHIKYN